MSDTCNHRASHLARSGMTMAMSRDLGSFTSPRSSLCSMSCRPRRHLSCANCVQPTDYQHAHSSHDRHKVTLQEAFQPNAPIAAADARPLQGETGGDPFAARSRKSGSISELCSLILLSCSAFSYVDSTTKSCYMGHDSCYFPH